ncbi:hypothetical protein J3R30DRAFT_3709996 [Lentinula aciculospora]|uniref:Uncharacterized protein n=1 Tax=Lentinula aciculospora TaxID=153920 RepID=A0A9W9A1Q2_9AGAR|nr:hypothetical protein J3R30DRAFT_3709996 [Lentinula aciculospora]
MLNTISLNRPTPMELAARTQTARENTWEMKYPPRRPAPLPSKWIRVKFYSHISRIRDEMLPDMEGEVMLDTIGALDMWKVCRLWNLEACVPVDPTRWVPVGNFRPRLSPFVVRALSERNRCLMFIEPTPLSPSTAHKRELREASIHLQTSLSMFSHLSFSVTSSVVHTSFDFIGRGTAKVNRVWVWWDERTKFPMWIRNGVMLLVFIFSWIATKTIASPVGRYVHRKNVLCKNRFKSAWESSLVWWVHEQMHWIVLSSCLIMLMVGLLLLLSSLGWDAKYRTMSLLR